MTRIVPSADAGGAFERDTGPASKRRLALADRAICAWHVASKTAAHEVAHRPGKRFVRSGAVAASSRHRAPGRARGAGRDLAEVGDKRAGGIEGLFHSAPLPRASQDVSKSGHALARNAKMAPVRGSKLMRIHLVSIVEE